MTLAVTSPEVTMPPGQWIPNADQLTTTGSGLLNVMGAAVDSYQMGDEFPRRVYSHGDTLGLHRGDTAVGQLLVAFRSLELGEAGQKQFQFPKGDIGSHAHMVAMYECEVWTPWPTPKGGLSARLPDDSARTAATEILNRSMFVIFASLRSLALSGGSTYGVTTNPPVTPTAQDGIIVGPAAPTGPSGGLAGFTIQVQVAYD